MNFIQSCSGDEENMLAFLNLHYPIKKLNKKIIKVSNSNRDAYQILDLFFHDTPPIEIEGKRMSIFPALKVVIEKRVD